MLFFPIGIYVHERERGADKYRKWEMKGLIIKIVQQEVVGPPLPQSAEPSPLAVKPIPRTLSLYLHRHVHDVEKEILCESFEEMHGCWKDLVGDCVHQQRDEEVAEEGLEHLLLPTRTRQPVYPSTSRGACTSSHRGRYVEVTDEDDATARL
jgi:hypothetical protein